LFNPFCPFKSWGFYQNKLKGTSKNYLKKNLWLTFESVFALFCLKTRQIRQVFSLFENKNSLKTFLEIEPNYFLEMPLKIKI